MANEVEGLVQIGYTAVGPYIAIIADEFMSDAFRIT